MTNRLAGQTSPYLLQHAENPVEWYPWGPEAFDLARNTNRPVLLSVGYSACHWCHVMAHESFENPAIAALMNELFVSIKVDREERPDVDAIYMQAVQAISGQGGWPMTVFCTPEGVPFFGGTYFPPEDRHRLRGFPFVLRAAADAYRSQRDAVEHTGAELRRVLAPASLLGGGEPTVTLLDQAADRLVEQADHASGGFGSAPKFPHSAAIDLLLRRWRVTQQPRHWETASLCLDRMARGGIHDQIGGGFHRYSVDDRWGVPHFEKMLYDNAQLAPVYLHAFQLSGQRPFLRVATATLDFMARELRLPGGGFASSLDADSEGEEGRYFAWTPAQLRDVLDATDAALAERVFGVVDGGNFERGSTVLSLPSSPVDVAATSGLDEEELVTRIDGIRAQLMAARERRIAPGRDDKVITSWNALAIGAFAEIGAATDRHDLVQVGIAAAGFVLEHLRPQGRLLRTWRDGQAHIDGFLEDHAYLCDALLTLHAATGDARWFKEAEALAGAMVERFHEQGSGFYDTAIDAEPLLVRPRTIDDNPIPAGQSMAAHALLRLFALTGTARWRDVAMTVVRPLADAVARAPLALANLGWALELAVSSPREVAVVGGADDPATRALLREVLSGFHPTTALAWGEVDGVPLLAGRPLVDGRPAAYVCSNFTCQAPVLDPVQLRSELAKPR